MLELLEKIEKLKQELDQLEIWKELESTQQEIFGNKELMDKIKKYNETLNSSLRLEIYQYELIKKYKELENKVGFIILEINQKFSLLKEKGGCKN